MSTKPDVSGHAGGYINSMYTKIINIIKAKMVTDFQVCIMDICVR